MQYRADIDGLRAIAVLLVLLFHAGLPYISGGFIGVDVFFVISGYLITSIIVAEAKDGRFSYLRFYERRARRILPALYAMALIVLLVTLIIQVPNDLIKTAKTLLFTTLFSSNIYFWRTTDYFSGASEFEFFLHTWSLGVEEQFYFLFPLVVLLFVRHGSWLLRLAVLALVLSFSLSVYTSYHHEWASYYLLPSRAWQLMMGALLAIAPMQRQLSQRAIGLLGLLALGLIIIPAFYYTKHTRFPGVAALSPTFGAALLIWLGSLSSEYWVGRLLASPLVRFFGLISYSLYLWHWPIFALLRNYEADIRLEWHLSLLGIVASVVMAYLSWRFVEAPFRDKARFSQCRIFIMAGVSSVIIISLCAMIVVLKGIPERIDPRIVRLSSYSESGVIDNPCMQKSASNIEAGDYCHIGDDSSGEATIAFWGDSHLGALKMSLSDWLADKQRPALFFGKTGCPPIAGVLKANLSDGQSCVEFNAAVEQLLNASSVIDTVVIHGRWALSVEGTRYASERGPEYVLKDSLEPEKYADNASVVQAGLRRVISQLIVSGKKVIIIAGVPEVGSSVPKVVANNLFWGKNRDIVPKKADFLSRQAAAYQVFEQLKIAFPQLTVVYPEHVLCDDEVCHILREDEPLYFDDDHLSNVGADLVVEQLAPYLRGEGLK